VNDKLNTPIFIVNADDLGLSDSATEGILAAHRDGVVTSASLVVTTRATDTTVARLADYPDLGIGLHFCLSAGRPVAEPDLIEDLVDEDGFFRWRFGSLFAVLSGPRKTVLLRQIEAELEAQIQRMLSFGIMPDHINGERHIHLLPGIIELVAAAAERHRIPHVRLIDDVGMRYLSARGVVTALMTGGIVKIVLLRFLSRRARTRCETLRNNEVRYATLLYTGRMHEVLPAVWANPPEGVTEIGVHPGAPADMEKDSGTGNKALSRYLASSDRRAEMEACIQLAGAATAARLGRFSQLSETP
jgi:predicted glycoside hydrolase/deacetylase ChbG (UPF0249 family)